MTVVETSNAMTTSTDASFCIIGDCSLKLWSLSQRERFVRQFKRASVLREIRETDAVDHTGKVILVRADGVIDQPLIQALCGGKEFFLKSTDGPIIAACVTGSNMAHAVSVLKGNEPVSGAFPVHTPDQLKAHFWQALRKREVPYALVLNEASRAAVEWRMFMGTYKGATDIITKHVWPRPAFHVTRFVAGLGITPNMVTTVGAVATVAAFFLFLKGSFGWGLLAAWLMTFLDTVDGKLARTTLTSSKWGDVFDHGIDLVHPPFWYAAWAFGLSAVGFLWSSSMIWWVIGVILGGYIVQRLFEGVAIKWLGLEIHIWRPIDTLFRQITARRNPNLILLTLFTLFGRPDLGILSVALWTVVCLVLHAIQLAQALAAKQRLGGHPLQSWMTAP